MGARIAAHIANAGVWCALLDIAPAELTPEEQKRGLWLASPDVRNRIVRAGLAAAVKAKPAAFFTKGLENRIITGNFEDDLNLCAEADWIIEAVAENLEIKRALLSRVAQIRKPGTIVSTNTSGLPVRRIAEGMDEEWQQYWAGTHFFNPPRYLKLVEIIPGVSTSPEVIETLSEFCDHKLGKGVVVAKDTPNFIGNRIGTFSMLNAIRLMNEMGMTFEEVDACTGPALGWPRSATFRLADIVGIDVLLHVIRNIYENIPNDESRDLYRVPALVEEMAKRGWLGDKTGSGFYKRVKKPGGDSEILTLDPVKMEYRPQQKARFASIEAGKAIENTRERLRMLVGPCVIEGWANKATRRRNSSGAFFRECAYMPRGARPKLRTRLWMLIAPCAGDLSGSLGRSRCGTPLGLSPWQSRLKKRDTSCRRSSERCFLQERNPSTSRNRARLRISIFQPSPTSARHNRKE